MAQEIADSKLLDTWGSGGTKIEPDITKIIEGWQLGEQPPHEYMNWLQNTFGSKLNHILKNGIAEWNNETEYLAGSSVKHSGNVWICETINTNSEPTDLNANWEKVAINKDLTVTVDTLADLRSISYPASTVWASGYHTKNDGAFGSHIFRLKGVKTTETDNGGTVVIATIGVTDYVYELQYDGAVNVKWFGAKGDGVTDDTVAVQNAINKGRVVSFGYGTYLTTVISFSMNNQYLDLIGSTLYADNISSNYDYCVLNLSGGIIDGKCISATVAVETTAGSNTIIVEDSSNLSIGNVLASSYYDVTKTTEYPLEGQIGRTITAINGNTITLSSNMSGTVTTLPVGLVVGNYNWGSLFGSTKNITIKNGTLRNVKGYYYHTKTGAVSSSVIFESIYFESNGLDQFLVKDNQVLKIKDCTANAPYDYAKTGIFIYDNGSCEINDSNLNLGNYDSCIAFNGTHTDSVLKITGNCTISGIGNSSIPASKCLNGISIAGTNGNINSITVSAGVWFKDIVRYFFTATDKFQSQSLTIAKILFQCDIEAIPYNLKYTGSGNGLTVNKFIYSNCNIYTNSTYTPELSGTSGAINSATIIFDNCNLRLQGSTERVFQNAVFNGGKFDSCATIRTTQNSNNEFNGTIFRNTLIKTGVGFSNEYQSKQHLFIIDNANFPLSINSCIDVSASRNGQICKIKSVNGSLVYTVVKVAGSTAFLYTDDIELHSDTAEMTGTDWYVTSGALVKKRPTGLGMSTYNIQTTLSATASAGATSINVTSVSYSGNRPATGDYVALKCDNGLVTFSKIASGYTDGSLTIPLTTAIDFVCTSGNNLSFFRVA